MTGRQLFVRVTRKHGAWSEDDLLRPDAHAELWSAVLESSSAGRAVAHAIEQRPALLDLDVSELCATLATFEKVGPGAAGRVAAVMGLFGHVQRAGELDIGDAER